MLIGSVHSIVFGGNTVSSIRIINGIVLNLRNLHNVDYDHLENINNNENTS